MPPRQTDEGGVGRVVDPTKNVLDLVQAAIQRQDDLRESEAKFQNAMREAETRRIAELSAQKTTFDLELAKVLRANQDAASTLLATQLKEVKNDLSDRTAKLEQFRWESGGKTTARGDVWGYIVGAVGIAVGITVVVTFVLNNAAH